MAVAQAQVRRISPRRRLTNTVLLGLCGSDDPYPDRPEALTGMKNFREAPAIAGARPH